jgi:hypothetical protein
MEAASALSQIRNREHVVPPRPHLTQITERPTEALLLGRPTDQSV